MYICKLKGSDTDNLLKCEMHVSYVMTQVEFEHVYVCVTMVTFEILSLSSQHRCILEGAATATDLYITVVVPTIIIIIIYRYTLTTIVCIRDMKCTQPCVDKHIIQEHTHTSTYYHPLGEKKFFLRRVILAVGSGHNLQLTYYTADI